MHCTKEECKYCRTFLNSRECGLTICSFDDNYGQVAYGAECMFTPKGLTCSDCYRLGMDTACMTAEGGDDASNCPGFMEAVQYQIDNLLFEKFCKGYKRDRLIEILDQCKKDLDDFKSPLEEKNGIEN